jgi:DNA-binding beta-propeller fold protein YncE
MTVARIRAPELSGTGGWTGTSSPVSLSDLAGKVVVLDFWTACCVNCIRVLEELRPLEQRFAEEAVFIGVHSPKFPHEHDHQAVARAVQRLRIAHPVIDDPDLTTWRQYGVQGWPTVVVIDPDGYVVGGISGEGCGPVVTQTIEGLVASHGAAGTLVRGRPAFLAESAPGPAPHRVLDYPGKVAVDASGRRLAVADTGHDRIVVCDLQGRLQHVVGGLHAPQGLRFDGERVVVCDTGADRIVIVDPPSGNQVVVAGSLASPWDVTVEAAGTYLVAEAGRHRLWRVGVGVEPTVVAGTGAENLEDGPALQAILAQPSGLAVIPGGIAFVDAESSALRLLTDAGEVVTLVGQGLFDWGVSDGGPESAALQHPTGVTSAEGQVYIADTYNNLLRAWSGSDASSGQLRTLPVEGLDEPGGLDALLDGRLVVADTNHHRIVLVDPATGVVDPLILDESWTGTVPGDALAAAPGVTMRIPIEVDLGALELDRSNGPPVRVEVTALPATLLGPGPRAWELDDNSGGLELVAGVPGTGVLTVDVAVKVCDDLQCSVLHAKTRHDLRVEEPGSTA